MSRECLSVDKTLPEKARHADANHKRILALHRIYKSIRNPTFTAVYHTKRQLQEFDHGHWIIVDVRESHDKMSEYLMWQNEDCF